MSEGRIKAVVLGSYERGDRAISLQRILEIAELYAVPVTALLSENVFISDHIQTNESFMIDLRRVRSLSQRSAQCQILANFAMWIIVQRSDWNGEVLSLRNTDLSLVALSMNSTHNDVLQWLREEKITFTAPNPL